MAWNGWPTSPSLGVAESSSLVSSMYLWGTWGSERDSGSRGKVRGALLPGRVQRGSKILRRSPLCLSSLSFIYFRNIIIIESYA